MKLINYLDQLGTLSEVAPDTKKLQRMPLVERIVEILTPAYLRLGPLDQKTREMLREKVKTSIKSASPITLILAMGGFKGAHIIAAPHINWAEVFHLDFLIKTLGEIAFIYQPGLKLEFSGDDIIVPLMNNYRHEWTEIYNREFDRLLELVAQNLPLNIVLSNRPASSFYERVKLEKEVNQVADKLELSQEKLQLKLKHAQNNYVLDGECDLTDLDVSEVQKRLVRSVAIHEAWLAVDYAHRREYLEGDTHIPIVHRKGIPGCYGIRSTKASDVQFWEAVGAVEVRGEKLIPRLLTANSVLANQSIVEVKTRFAELTGLRNITVI